MSAWSEDHSRRLLSPLGRRWQHARAVADTARKLAIGLAPEDADVLVAAAYLHDVGYAPELASTGFHPLDGARHLRGLGHERLAGLVAHHTQGRHEAKLRGLQEALAEFDDEDSLVSAALAYCDLTTGPSGERMTPGQRLFDVEARYGDDSPVTAGLREAWPELLSAVESVGEFWRQAVEVVPVQPIQGSSAAASSWTDVTAWHTYRFSRWTASKPRRAGQLKCLITYPSVRGPSHTT